MKLALWILRNKDALAGDILERFHCEHLSSAWLWKQVLVVVAIRLGRHWPHFCYAIAGSAAPAFLWRTIDSMGPRWPGWYKLPWPASMIVFELKTPLLLALAALPVLAIGLLLSSGFRWDSVWRTAGWTAALAILFHFVPDALPWLYRREGPYLFPIFPQGFFTLAYFLLLLAAAWLGAPLPKKSYRGTAL